MHRVGDALHIRTTEKQLAADKRTKHSCIKSKAEEEKPIVIVGGSFAAQSAAENLRLAGSKSPIIMLTKESHAPYDKVVLSKVTLFL